MGKKELRAVIAAAVEAGDLAGGLGLLARLDPLTRFGTGRKLATLYGRASVLSESRDEGHLLRLTYLLAIGRAPDTHAGADDHAAVAALYGEARQGAPAGLPPWRTTQAAALLSLLTLGAAVAAWLWVPRAYQGLDLLAPVVAGAYESGGRPSPGTEAQRGFFEHALPAFMIALDREADRNGAAAALLHQAASAELPAEALSAVEGFAGACAAALEPSPEDPAGTGQERGVAVQRAGARLNAALASVELGYYVDTQVTMSRDGRLRVFFETFVVERVAPYQLGPHTERALLIRRLDHSNIALQTLGFTRAEANEALVQLDTIEEHLIAHLLPALQPDTSFRFAGPEVQRSDTLARLEAIAGAAVREELLALLDSEAAVTLGTTLHERRALFERWQGLASRRDAVFRAPTRYEVDMPALERFRWQLDGFSELREMHRVLGQGEVVAAYLRARDALAGVVERHELQHRYDYREGVFETVPAGLSGSLLRLAAGEPLDDRARVVVAELSAYSASIAESRTLPKTELILLGRHVLGLGGGRRNEAQAAGFLLQQLDAELFPAGPIVGRAPIHHGARLERLLEVPQAQLTSATRALWERWFGRALPPARPTTRVPPGSP